MYLKYSDTEFLPGALEGLGRPFMLMGKDGQTHLNEPSWQSLWDRSTRWKRDLSPEPGAHFSYPDAQTIVRFHQHLRGRPQHLLDGSAPSHPDVRFVQ
ncbi:hypothetical protein GCM10009579_30990 [Streptomyces javensis]|uniref:Uncharacterized protein n=2 Tax=Streptomyces javensis TaxID=114698 RepID=A0ABN1WZZ6_9ACTN